MDKVNEVKSNTETFIYKDEPHLITLVLGNDTRISIVSFYEEQDFNPKIPIGDDIWIIRNTKEQKEMIQNLKLELIYNNGAR